jgi:hypothetical protein
LGSVYERISITDGVNDDVNRKALGVFHGFLDLLSIIIHLLKYAYILPSLDHYHERHLYFGFIY